MVEYVTTVSAVVFAVCKGERGSTAHADIRVYPFWGLEKRSVVL